MTRPVPGATSALRVLRFLGQFSAPVPAARIAAELGLPRSSMYHLLTAMAAESFVVHYPEDRSWGLGVATWEVGLGFARQEPLARLARGPISRLVDDLGFSAHLAALYASDVVYLVEERAVGRARLVTDVGVRLPAHLTATGRAILASLPAAQVRALYPSADRLVRRTEEGPRTLADLRTILARVRRLGYADEDSEVSPGFGSVALGLASHTSLAAVAVTWEHPLGVPLDEVLARLRQSVDVINARLR
ncbi:MAG TPA: IclR family transcriptional regulator C-terminal domain-containing protein [Propionibacteriaceae bacterium]|nr:IclR family transcriptional regulator C-terminal domain-containing protein [Propionibacteriaceae bacterium]